MRHAALAAAVALTATSSVALAATTLYSNDFDTNTTANWVVNKGGANQDNTGADFFFDYSAFGIPAAPGSTTTRGLKLWANQAGTAATPASGVSVSPVGQSFTGNYQLSFNLWHNYNGDNSSATPVGIAGGGNGSTQITGAGIGTAGTSAQWQAGTHDSVHFGMAGDGGTTVDVRAYSPAQPQSNTGTGYADASGVFAAGTTGSPRAHGNAYYTAFLGNQPAPQAQLQQYPSQFGNTLAGAPGFTWLDVDIKVIDNVVTWHVNDVLIATVPLEGLTLGGTNILLNHYDINMGISNENPNLIFGVIDNLTVVDLDPPLRITGDTNGDGVVDLVDLNNVLNNFGATGASPGDDNGDGVVDLTDLNNVLNNFGDTASASALSVVPEPSSLACLFATLPLLTRRRRPNGQST